MKKAIVTGANSFIGYRLCKILSENGYYVYAVLRSINKNNKILEKLNNVKIILMEMQHYKCLNEILKDCCDVGVLLAWNGTRGDDRDNRQKQMHNCWYSEQCVDCFIENGCKTIVTAGSQAEYGIWNKREKLTEDVACKPITEYGKYKYKLYRYASEECEKHHIRLIEPRYFSLYGHDDYEETLIISTILKMLHNRKCELTQCIQLWDFLHVDDAVDALYKLIESEDACGVYNFGSGVARELRDYIMTMYKMTGTHSELKFGAVPYPKTGMVYTNPSVEKLCSSIQWKPQISFEEGIAGIISEKRRLMKSE